MNSESLRKEYNKNLIKITNYYSELAQNLKIFKGYQHLKDKEFDVGLNAIQKKIVNDELKGFELGGIGLPRNKRESFKLIKSNISKLSSQFEENILDSINNFSFHIESKVEVEGIPKDVLNKARMLAKENNKKGWLFTLDFPSYIPLMQYAKNRKLREDMYRAYATKASELSNKKLDNGPCINEILLLKQKLASLLSYENYAEMSLVTKMANSSDEVVKFLNKLAKKAKPHATKDMKDLNEIAKKFNINSIEAWDIAYLSEIIKEKNLNKVLINGVLSNEEFLSLFNNSINKFNFSNKFILCKG